MVCGVRLKCYAHVAFGVSHASTNPMLDEDDLAPADEQILQMLREGRVTAPFVAEKTGYSLQYVRERLNRMVEHDNARKVYDGLYELVDDPREGDADE